MGFDRRGLLGAGVTVAAAALTGCGGRRAPVWGEPVAAAPAAEPLAMVAPVYGERIRGVLARFLQPTPDNPGHPGYAGAVALVTVNGGTTVHTAVGHAVRYQAGPVELPASRRVPMKTGAIFDLASLTKVYTAIVVLQLVEQGKVDLAAPLQRYLPEFTGAGKGAVTISMLLSHTSALPVGAAVTGLPDNAARWRAVLATPLVKGGVPGTTFRYSSVGLMVLGRLVEKITGKSLDKVIRDNLTAPLGLKDTGFLPLKWVSDKNRLVATDARTSRGLLRGTVHDDVCDLLGGVAGHAGMFATAADVAVIGQMLLDGGVYRGKRILAAATVARMLTNVNKGKPAVDPDRPHRTADHGLGVELDQSWFMGKLTSAATFGHTGFTGTSLLVEPRRKLVLVLLTNRAHPDWSWSNPDPHRVAVADTVAAAIKA